MTSKIKQKLLVIVIKSIVNKICLLVKECGKVVINADREKMAIEIKSGVTDLVTEYDKKILELVKDKKHIIVINKSDLKKENELEGIEISALDQNIDKLKEEIVKKIQIDVSSYKDKGLLSNTRQIGLMKQALESLNNAYNACLCYTPVDLLEIDVRSSLDAILDLLGERSKVDLDKEIFSKFCLGK
jgi:tRNA modification GTPase